MSGPAPLHVCAVCGRWRNINPVCGLCRAARAFGSIAFDPRLTEAGVLPILDILDRTVGEVYGLLATQPAPLPPSISGAAPDLPGKLLFLLGRLLRLRELRRRFRFQGEPQRNLAPRPLLLFLREEVVFQLRLVAWQGLAHLLRTIARHCLGVFL